MLKRSLGNVCAAIEGLFRCGADVEAFEVEIEVHAGRGNAD